MSAPTDEERQFCADVQELPARFGMFAWTAVERPGEAEADLDRVRALTYELVGLVRRNAERRAISQAKPSRLETGG